MVHDFFWCHIVIFYVKSFLLISALLRPKSSHSNCPRKPKPLIAHNTHDLFSWISQLCLLRLSAKADQADCAAQRAALFPPTDPPLATVPVEAEGGERASVRSHTCLLSKHISHLLDLLNKLTARKGLLSPKSDSSQGHGSRWINAVWHRQVIELKGPSWSGVQRGRGRGRGRGWGLVRKEAEQQR